MTFLLSVRDLSYHLPDGTQLFCNFNFNICNEKVGIVGKNGVGKSTLLKIIINELKPTTGSIIGNEKVSYLPQNINDFSNYSLAQILNIDKKLFALKLAESGQATEKDILTIGDDWNLENEIKMILKNLGLDSSSFERKGESFSGGELIRILLAKISLEKTNIILLDEPTNNLDKESKDKFYDFIQNIEASILAVSHDRVFLNKMDAIIEISNLGLKYYKGNYDFYLLQRKIEDDSAQQKLLSFEEKLKKQRLQEQEVIEKHKHSSSQGKAKSIKQGMSPLEIGFKINSAHKTISRLKITHEKRTNQFQNEYENQKEKLRDNYKINVDLLPSNVPARKKMIICRNLNYKFENSDRYLWKDNLNIEIIGCSRVNISGRNGAGKTTLIELITGKKVATCGEIYVGSKNITLLDQKCSLLNDNITLFENLKKYTPDDMKEHDIRIRAGRFLFYGNDVFKKTSCLSGGERLRASLACILTINQTPDILILDEPTNNLDIDSIEILTKSLNYFDGTLIVISHDNYFLNDIRIDKQITLQ